MRRGGRGLLGAALLGAGVLIVASRIGVFGALPAFVWVVILFVVGGAVWSGAAGRLPMWQRIVAFSVLAVLAMVTAGRFAGVAALGFPAMAFLLVYGGRRRSWWALIPGGMLASIALFITAATLFPRWEPVPLMFLGFSATFTLLYVLPAERGGQRWALIPALVWIGLTVLVNSAGSGPKWLLPTLLIFGGLAMALGWGRGRRPG